MKMGDLVRLSRGKKIYTISEWNSVGIIVEALTSGIARKNNSYLVMWPEALENSKHIRNREEWYAAPSIEKVK
ncbi:MAG: hypothetical protein CMO97_02115 [Woeseia sp.]|nr:hypothetical protein [Woeseia sp.]|tara:strand:+ start:2215 stop:2433 length:219 start_codon:yes stop_codon:yes gene_type:complete